MSRERLRVTSTSLRLIQRFRLLGTWASIRRATNSHRRAVLRLSLLQAETRHQLLLLKELEQNLQQANHRLQELSPEQFQHQELLNQRLLHQQQNPRQAGLDPETN